MNNYFVECCITLDHNYGKAYYVLKFSTQPVYKKLSRMTKQLRGRSGAMVKRTRLSALQSWVQSPVEETILIAFETVFRSFLAVAQWLLAFLHLQKLQTTYLTYNLPTW